MSCDKNMIHEWRDIFIYYMEKFDVHVWHTRRSNHHGFREFSNEVETPSKSLVPPVKLRGSWAASWAKVPMLLLPRYSFALRKGVKLVEIHETYAAEKAGATLAKANKAPWA